MIFDISRTVEVTDTVTGNEELEKHVGRLRKWLEQITVTNKKLEKQVVFYGNQVQNLTIWYLLYQIIFFAASSSSPLPCEHWWVPLLLSLIPAILYFAALGSGLSSYHNIQCQLDMYYIEQQRIRGLVHDAENQKVSNDAVLVVDREHVMKPDGFVVFKRLVCIWTAVLVLVGFTAVVLWSPRVLLCRR